MADWGPFSLTGKVAVVTGGGGGIGLGIVQGLAQAGATVMAVGRRAEGAAVIAAHAPGADWFQADLASPQAPDAVIAEAVRRHGGVDILVNNAAALGPVPLADMTADYIDNMAAVNIRAVLLLCRAFAAAREGRGPGGKIVNVGSVEGYIANLPAGMGAYSATKTAVRGLTVSLARELGPMGIGVNGVAPGGVAHQDLLARFGMTPGLETLKARTNVGRLGTAEDIANVCVFLASAASNFISGQMIVADGGAAST